MPTDYPKMSENLCRFYDFTGKIVLYVGAAGRQLLDPGLPVKKMIAIDKLGEGLTELQKRIAVEKRSDRVQVISSGFEQITMRGDVVYFEFCLHEMDDPAQALQHAKSLATDIVVYDHSVGSEWSYLGAEEDLVVRSTEAMRRMGIRKRETFLLQQTFDDFAQLRAKLEPRGPVALERIQRFATVERIAIPMPHELNLL